MTSLIRIVNIITALLKLRSKYRDAIVLLPLYQDLTSVYWMETYHNTQSSFGVIYVTSVN